MNNSHIRKHVSCSEVDGEHSMEPRKKIQRLDIKGMPEVGDCELENRFSDPLILSILT